MYAPAECLRIYRRNATETASRGQIVLLLFDGALRAIERAQAAMNRPAHDFRRFGVVHDEVRKALLIIAELKGSLDHRAGGEFAATMDRLYDYYGRRLRLAVASSSEAPLIEVHGLLLKIRDSWAKMLQHPPEEVAQLQRSA
jgi:flagellar protein FliS